MDIEKFYSETNSGAAVAPQEILEYIGNFDKVVIWGMSWLGKSIAAHLSSHGIHIDDYWDLRAAEIGQADGNDVHLPFSTEYDREGTLIICCISNRVIQVGIEKTLRDKEYTNILIGFNLFMAVLCPSNVENGLDIRFCANSKSCLKIYCTRLASLFALKHAAKKQTQPLHLHGITIVLNQICNLSCKHCTSYMNQYAPPDRVNFSKKNIVRDIDNFFNSVDSVASITVMGGEPFMHPDISDIMAALLRHENAGFISISTNGVHPMQPAQMASLADERVVVAFNNYLPSLPEKMRSIFALNVELVKSRKIAYSIGHFMPNWEIPTTLYDLKFSKAKTKARYEACLDANRRQNYGFIHRQLKNGRLYPCDMANALHSLGVADYRGDYVDVSDADNLRQRLHDHYHARFYHSCGHCRGTLGDAGPSAIQGKINFIAPPETMPLDAYLPE